MTATAGGRRGGRALRPSRWPRWSSLDLEGDRISYCVLGAGPTIAVVKPHRAPPVYDLVWLLSDAHTVVQIEPLGFATSDRPAGGALRTIAEQVLAVLDYERVEEFAVWGQSLGGAMAMVVAQASDRATAMIVNGGSPLDTPTPSVLRRMDRELAPKHSGDPYFWRAYSRFDWTNELDAMSCRKLVYVGSDDGPRMRGPRGIERTRELLEELGVTVKVFDGLNHLTCASEPALSSRVLPVVLEWLNQPPAAADRTRHPVV